MKMIKVLLVSLLINLPTFFSSQVSTDIALYTERLSIFYFFKTNKNNSVHFCQYSDSSDTFISCCSIAVRQKCDLSSCCVENKYLTHSHFQLIKGVHMTFWFIRWPQPTKYMTKKKMAPWVLEHISWLCFMDRLQFIFAMFPFLKQIFRWSTSLRSTNTTTTCSIWT